MAILGAFPTVRQQVTPTAGFAAAFTYLEDILRPESAARARLRALEPGASGRIELAAGAYVMEQVYASRARSEGFFESHRKYIDVQAIVEGEELIEVIDAAVIRAREPYNPERDLILYHDTAEATQAKLRAGDVAVFFPSDVHMPCLRLHPMPGIVRKAVVKVPVSPSQPPAR